MLHRPPSSLFALLLAVLFAGCSRPAAQVSQHFDVTKFGARGDGVVKQTVAIQMALDKCAAAGGGEVVVPPGKYLIGSVQIGSNTTLRLSDGATLIGSPDPDDYPLIPVRFEGETVEGHRALIYGNNAKHVSIQGPGTLMGDMKIGDLRRPRAPLMIELVNCDDVHLNDFKDRYRRMWSIHLLFCHNVRISNLNIRTTKTNGDGIDVDSTDDVQIEHCDIDTGDDCISLKSGRGAAAARLALPTANIVISNCTLGSNYAGVGIGTEMSSGVHDVRIEHCKFTRGDNAVFLKSRFGRSGVISNIYGEDFDTTSKTCIGINLVNKGIVGSDPVPGIDGIPQMSNIRFDRIHIHSGVLVDGRQISADKPVDGFSLTNVTGSCSKAITLANVVHATLANIKVIGFSGPLLTTYHVTGTGLEAAVPPGPSGALQFRRSFLDPPDDARPMVRWWWFGPAVTKPELAREMDAMKAGGFGGFEIQPTYPLAVDDHPAGLKNLPFLSPGCLDALNFTAKYAKEAGLRMDLTLGSGWPFGGPMFPITQAAGALRIASTQPSSDQTTVALPNLRAGETLIAAFAGKDGLSMAPLATLGKTIQLPADLGAEANVMFFISSRTGMKVKRPALGAEGYVLDHDNPSAVETFVTQVGEKEIEACGPDIPHSIFCDSLEVNGEDWTDTFLNEFLSRRGYDLRPLLPALVTDVGPRTLEIRHDWGQTLTELFNDSFVKRIRSLAEDHKTRFRIQAYGSPSAALFSYGDADLPEGEGYQWHGYRASRFAGSASHLMGNPITSSEAFTWIHNLVFRATPLDIKAEADLHFLQGINQLICHGWPYTAAHVPDPGWSFYAAGVFDEKNPWYIVMPQVTKYLQRVSYVMRQGQPANDVALYLANSDAWAHFTPGHVSVTDAVGRQLGPRIVGEILDAGFNLDFFDDQMLARFGKVSNGTLAFGDLRYHTVMLAGVERIPLETMRGLEQFARAGGTLIATRRVPAIVPGYKTTPADQKELGEIVQRLFHGPNAPGIFLADETKLSVALRSRSQPDFQLLPAAPQVGFVHRHTDYAEIYFVANTSNQPVATRATFKVEGLKPFLLDAVDGQVTAVTIIDRPAGGTSITLALEPYQSSIVVWTKDTLTKTFADQTNLVDNLAQDLSSGWNVKFGNEAASVPMDRLPSWTEDATTRYFSGVATYSRQFTAPEAALTAKARLILSFGDSVPTEERSDILSPGYETHLSVPVRDAAVVKINDKEAGSLWCPPYRLDVSQFLQPGENNINIEVANSAVNAIAGRGFPNYDVKAINVQFGKRFPVPRSEQFQPQPSGLLGPIRLFVEEKPLNASAAVAPEGQAVKAEATSHPSPR